MTLTCEQEISFSNDFGDHMTARTRLTFDVKDVHEGDRMAAFFQRNLRCHIRPLWVMDGHEMVRAYQEDEGF